jgi:hypothetical protein
MDFRKALSLEKRSTITPSLYDRSSHCTETPEAFCLSYHALEYPKAVMRKNLSLIRRALDSQKDKSYSNVAS